MLSCWRLIKMGEKTTVGYMVSTKADDSTKTTTTCNPLVQPGADRYSVNSDGGTCRENNDKVKKHVFIWKTLSSVASCDNEPKAGSTNAYYEGTTCKVDPLAKIGDDNFLWECKICQTPLP